MDKVTSDINFDCETNDLKALYLATKSAYPNMGFLDWCKECEKSFVSYSNKNEKNKMTYSQFVNGQILAMQGW